MCAPTVEPIPQGRGGILLQESIADFLYFSRKAYFLRLNMSFKTPLTPIEIFQIRHACRDVMP